MLRIIEKQFRQPEGIIGRIISFLMRKNNSNAYDRIINKLDIKDNENIFEIGYGHGYGVERILSKNNCFVSGIDFSELMNKEALERNNKNIDNGKAKLYYGDFLKYEIDSNLYDKIFFMNVIYFWDNLEIAFSKIRIGLKEKGNFCFYMDHPDELIKQGFTKDDIFNRYTIEQVVDKLKLSSFNEINYQYYENGYYVKCNFKNMKKLNIL